MGKTAPCDMYCDLTFNNNFTSLEKSDENWERNGSVRFIIYHYYLLFKNCIVAEQAILCGRSSRLTVFNSSLLDIDTHQSMVTVNSQQLDVVVSNAKVIACIVNRNGRL